MVMDAGLEGGGRNPDAWTESEREPRRSSSAGSNTNAGQGKPDHRKLAQDWITLWQSELSAMAADPEMRESWQAAMALWAGMLTAAMRSAPRATGPTATATDPYERTHGFAGSPDASRAAPVAAAPDARDAEIERLARHVATLERRLAELERGGDPPVDPKHHTKRRARK